MDRKSIKSRAKNQLGDSIFSNRWLMALAVCVVAGVITSGVSLIGSIFDGASLIGLFASISENGFENVDFDLNFGSSFGTLATLVLSGPISFGVCRLFINLARRNEDMDFPRLFDGFREKFADNIILGVLVSVFTALWSLLFIIPGIVKYYSYSMIFFIKADHPEYDWKTCFNQSKSMMTGHKGELFVLDLSFIGWYFVGMLCLGIGVIWVSPYVQAAKTNFYLDLIREFDIRVSFSPEGLAEAGKFVNYLKDTVVVSVGEQA